MINMSSDDNQIIDDDESIDDWVERENNWNRISDWQALMLAKKQSYFLSRINSLGYEYYNDTKQWDVLIEREWQVLQNRYNSGLGLEEEILESFGEEFFTRKQELEEEMLELLDGMETDRSIMKHNWPDYILMRTSYSLSNQKGINSGLRFYLS